MPARRRKSKWALPLLLLALTFLSTFYVGATSVLGRQPGTLAELASGWVFSVPLMGILLAHEFGHYFAAMYHRIDVSPPYFIPVPIAFGTMGAVIQMRERIRSRDALLDVGASGPLAGLVVAIPVLIHGLNMSEVAPIPDGSFYVEGRSLLYLGLLAWLKGPIPEGYDVWLTPTALAGWVGLLVTMINLLPFGQLDGGHIAYALVGRRQDRVSRFVLRAVPVLALLVCAVYGISSYVAGVRGDRLLSDSTAGMQWLVWGFVLWILSRRVGSDHPPTEPSELSPTRRWLGWFTLLLFVLLFMPSWLRAQ